MSAITTIESCEYRFTTDELVQLARDQARYSNEKRAMEDRFGALKKQHNADIELKEAEIRRAGLSVTQGYDLREVKCLTLRFRPNADSMLVVRLDNGRVMKQRRMREDEKQLTLSTSVDPFVFQVELYEDGTGDLLAMIAEVPLTA